MANVFVQDGSLTAIGDAIRKMSGGDAKYKPAEMAPAITELGRPPEEEFWAYGGHTAAVNDISVNEAGDVLTVGSDKSVALLTADGQEVWKYIGDVAASVGSVVRSGEGVTVYVGGPTAFGVKCLVNGAEVWSVAMAATVKSVTPVDGAVYLGGDEGLLKLTASGESVWELPSIQFRYVAVDLDGSVYGCGIRGHAKVSPAGEQIWSTDILTTNTAGVAICIGEPGSIYRLRILGRGRFIDKLSADNGTRVWVASCPAAYGSTISFVNGRVYATGTKGFRVVNRNGVILRTEGPKVLCSWSIFDTAGARYWGDATTFQVHKTAYPCGTLLVHDGTTPNERMVVHGVEESNDPPRRGWNYTAMSVTSVSADSVGNLYFPELAARAIWQVKLGPDGKKVWARPVSPGACGSIWAKHGYLYESGNNVFGPGPLCRITEDGNTMWETDFVSISNASINKAGNVAVNFLGQVRKYRKDGELLVEYSSLSSGTDQSCTVFLDDSETLFIPACIVSESEQGMGVTILGSYGTVSGLSFLETIGPAVSWITVDEYGTIFISNGMVDGCQYAILKTGDILWARTCMALRAEKSPSGNILCSGESGLMAYDSYGTEIWSKRDSRISADIDQNGKIYAASIQNVQQLLPVYKIY